MGEFLDVILPPFLLLVFGMAFLIINGIIGYRYARRWLAEQNRIIDADKLLGAVQDFLAVLIDEESAGRSVISDGTQARLTDLYQEIRIATRNRKELR